MRKAITKAIAANNSFSDPFEPQLYDLDYGFMNISVSGTWVGEVTVQRSFDNTNWFKVISFTANVEKALIEYESGVAYRIGTTSYTSGTINVRLSN